MLLERLPCTIENELAFPLMKSAAVAKLNKPGWIMKMFPSNRRMSPPQKVDRVRQDHRGVGSSLRHCDWAAEAEPDSSHRNLRQPEGFGNAVAYPEVRRIHDSLVTDHRLDAIEAQAQFVDQVRTEGVGLVKGEDLMTNLEHITEVRDCRRSIRWLAP